MKKETYKIQQAGGSKWKQYGELVVGSTNFWVILKYELLTGLLGWLPGALGLFLRSKLYPFLFRRVGRGVVFGRNLTLRHPHKIEVGDHVVVDDGCLLDAKGSENDGILIGDGVFIGRGSSIYCKNGNITLKDRVNIGIGCIIFSSNALTIGSGSMLAAHCYLLSGGNYDYHQELAFVEQSGALTEGPLEIGKNCWLGAKVVVLDHASIGDNSVIGACALVHKPIPPNSVAVGVPAKIIKSF